MALLLHHHCTAEAEGESVCHPRDYLPEPPGPRIHHPVHYRGQHGELFREQAAQCRNSVHSHDALPNLGYGRLAHGSLLLW